MAQGAIQNTLQSMETLQKKFDTYKAETSTQIKGLKDDIKAIEKRLEEMGETFCFALALYYINN